MGTHSLTYVHEDDGDPVICIYRQYDGYFEGVGDELVDFLKGKTMVNGFGGSDTSQQFNGAGDLAARLVTHYKGGDENAIGSVYILPSSNEQTEGYTYRVYCKEGDEPRIEATDYSGRKVAGPASKIVWPTDES